MLASSTKQRKLCGLSSFRLLATVAGLLAIPGIALSATSTPPTARLTYTAFAQTCLNHFLDDEAIAQAAHTFNLERLTPSQGTVWRYPPEPSLAPFAASFRERQLQEGSMRIWRRSPSDLSLELKTDRRPQGATCAVSSNAGARDVAAIATTDRGYQRDASVEHIVACHTQRKKPPPPVLRIGNI